MRAQKAAKSATKKDRLLLTVFIATFLFVLCFGYFVLPSLTPHYYFVYVVQTTPGSPANGIITQDSMILNWNGYNVSTLQGLQNFLSGIQTPYYIAHIETNVSSYSITSNATGKIGVELAQGTRYSNMTVAISNWIFFLLATLLCTAGIVYSSRNRIPNEKLARYFIYLLGLQVLALLVLPTAPFPSPIGGAFGTLLSNFRNTSAVINSAPYIESVSLIFTHNLRIATFDILPFIGILVYAVQVFATALLAGGLASQISGSSSSYVVALLLTFPYAWVELSSYAIACAQGIVLTEAFFKGQFKISLVKSLKIWVISLVMLLFAASLESAVLVLKIPLAYVTWIPFALVLFVVLKLKLHRKVIALRG